MLSGCKKLPQGELALESSSATSSSAALRTRAGILPWNSPPQYKLEDHWLQDSGTVAVSAAWGWPRHVDQSLGWAEQAGGSPKSPCELKKMTFMLFRKKLTLQG